MKNLSLNLAQNTNITDILLKFRTFIALFLLMIIFTVLEPKFIHPHNLVIVLKHATIFAFLGIGMTFVIISGGIDLSVGSIVGLTGMIAGGLIYEGFPVAIFGINIYFHPIMVILISLFLGSLVGLVNGLIVTRFGVAPFIVTLGTMYVARGLGKLRSNGMTFPNLAGDPKLGNQGFLYLGSGEILGLPASIWLIIILAIFSAYISRKTPLGRHIYAVGGNENAAVLSGIRVSNIKLFVYTFAGFCSAMAGLIWASQLNSSHPRIGETFELNAIAAAVLGGTSLSGGRGTVGGTIIGALVIGVLGDGMVMVGVSSFWQDVIKGSVIVLAAIIDVVQAQAQRGKSS